MSDDDRFVFAYMFSRRNRRPWRGRERTRPKMPSRAWRLAAVTVTAIGALLGLAAAASFDWTPWRWALIGAGVGFLVGMYAVETVWERRVAEVGSTDGPISPRH